MNEIDEDLGVRGGQGRTAGENADLAWFWGMFALAILVALVMLFGGVGCSASSRPSARVEGEKPHWEELREQMGGL